MRHAYVDRNTLLGDPDFVKAPLGMLLSRDYAARLREAILPNRATPSDQVKPGVAPHEGTNTTHYSIVDSKGNAVSTTYTLNSYFGAVVMAGNTGIFLNDEMDDFTSKPGVPNLYGLVQGENNAIAPGKRPLSSMAPTFVTHNGKLFMVFGSPGGSRVRLSARRSAVTRASGRPSSLMFSSCTFAPSWPAMASARSTSKPCKLPAGAATAKGG